jgi:hypothetical protein
VIDTKILQTLATNAKFTPDAIFIDRDCPNEVRHLAINLEDSLALWAKFMGKKFTIIRAKGIVINIPASIAPEVQSMNQPEERKMNVADAVLFSNFDPKVWSQDWVRLLENMVESDRPQVLIRISDQRQLWCNQLFADVMRSGGNEIVQRSINDFWLPADLIRLNQELRSGSDFEIDYSARLNDAGLWGVLRAQNNIYELGGTFYRLSTNLECNLISEPVTAR